MSVEKRQSCRSVRVAQVTCALCIQLARLPSVELLAVVRGVASVIGLRQRRKVCEGEKEFPGALGMIYVAWSCSAGKRTVCLLMMRSSLENEQESPSWPATEAEH